MCWLVGGAGDVCARASAGYASASGYAGGGAHSARRDGPLANHEIRSCVTPATAIAAMAVAAREGARMQMVSTARRQEPNVSPCLLSTSVPRRARLLCERDASRATRDAACGGVDSSSSSSQSSQCSRVLTAFHPRGRAPTAASSSLSSSWRASPSGGHGSVNPPSSSSSGRRSCLPSPQRVDMMALCSHTEPPQESRHGAAALCSPRGGLFERFTALVAS